MVKQSTRQTDISLPVSPDLDDFFSDDVAACKTCGIPVPIVNRDVVKWADATGYERFRIRVLTDKCKFCDERTVFRYAAHTIKNGKFVDV